MTSDDVARRVLRADLDQPGWAHIDLGPDLGGPALREVVVDLGRELDRLRRARFGSGLVFVSMSRFDQQTPTRPHRDGGPDGAVLLLGYEPTEVPSRLFLLDYTRAASDRGLTPAEFLACCNPAFAGGDELAPYTVRVEEFDPTRAQLVVVNNSVLPVGAASGMLGVLHHAEIEPRAGKRRVINSVLMGTSDEPTGLGPAEVAAFVETGQAVVW